MPNLPNGPTGPAKPSPKNAKIWAAVIGIITAGLVFWILESQGFVMRLIAGVVGGVAVAISSYRKSAKKNAESDEQNGRNTE